MKAQHVFFIRGLSTYGRDVAKWSVFDFGPVYQHLAYALSERGLQFHPVLGLGAGSLPEISERALHFLDQHPIWNDPTADVHLFGHSAGGLIVRLLLSRLKRLPLSALTVATPHRGSALAEVAVNMKEKNPGSELILRTFGYNLQRKKHFFDELTPAGLRRVFGPAMIEAGEDGRRGIPPSVRAGSIVCAAPREKWCLPLKAFYKVKAFDNFKLPSDGVVERDSQPWGEILAEVPIDHFRQVGLFRSGPEFEYLTDRIAEYFKSV